MSKRKATSAQSPKAPQLRTSIRGFGQFGAIRFTAADSFDAVTAFYSIIHVPREEHYALFQCVVRWLRPGGVFMGSLSASGKGQAASYEDDFFGAPMYWSNYDAITNQRMVAEAGLQIVMADQKTHDFNDETETWLWILAANPG